MSIELKLEQPENALVPILVTDGILTVVRLKQSENAFSPMIDTEGTSTEVMRELSEKQQLLKAFILCGRDILVMFLFCAKTQGFAFVTVYSTPL